MAHASFTSNAVTTAVLWTDCATAQNFPRGLCALGQFTTGIEIKISWIQHTECFLSINPLEIFKNGWNSSWFLSVSPCLVLSVFSVSCGGIGLCIGNQTHHAKQIVRTTTGSEGYRKRSELVIRQARAIYSHVWRGVCSVLAGRWSCVSGLWPCCHADSSCPRCLCQRSF